MLACFDWPFWQLFFDPFHPKLNILTFHIVLVSFYMVLTRCFWRPEASYIGENFLYSHDLIDLTCLKSDRVPQEWQSASRVTGCLKSDRVPQEWQSASRVTGRKEGTDVSHSGVKRFIGFFDTYRKGKRPWIPLTAKQNHLLRYLVIKDVLLMADGR